MSAAIIPFHLTADDAWQAFQALNDEALADERLMFDRAHFERRLAAHEQFARLYRRECSAAARHEGTAA